MASLLDLAERVRNSFQQKATQGLANVQRGIGTAALNMQTGVGNVRSAVQDWQAKPSNQVFNALKTPQGQQQLLATANKNASYLPKPIGQPLNFIANLGINRTVAPLMQVPYNVKEAIGGQPKSLPQRGLHGLMAAGGAFPLDDPLWMGYDFLKGSNKYDERNKGVLTNLKSGLQSMSLQKPVGLGEVVAPQGTARDIANVAELPALLVAGGVKTKNLKDRTKILNNETNIKAAVGWLSKWGDRFVDPDMSFRRYDHIVKTAKEIIPEVYNSKYMKKMEKYDPDGWAKTMASILDGTLEQAKNPQLNIGFNVRDISKRKDVQAPGGSGIEDVKNNIKRLQAQKDRLLKRAEYKNNVLTIKPEDRPKLDEINAKLNQLESDEIRLIRAERLKPPTQEQQVTIQKAITQKETELEQINNQLYGNRDMENYFPVGVGYGRQKEISKSFSDTTMKKVKKAVELQKEIDNLKTKVEPQTRKYEDWELKRGFDIYGHVIPKQPQPPVAQAPVSDIANKTFYHGTTAKFDKFDNSKMGTSTDTGMFGKGFYFTDDIKEAQHYSKGTGIVKEVKLDLKNPYVINSQSDIPKIEVPNKTLDDLKNGAKNYSEAFTKYLKDKGYDGVIDNIGPKKQYIVFDSSQIKSTPPSPVSDMGGGIFKNKEFSFVRNPEKAPNMGSRFGQDIEPAGRYINLMDEGQTFVPQGWETGKVTFKNPLVLDWGGQYGDATNWKNVLSKKYGGKTGKALSEAIRKDGFDGIITLDNGKPSEVVSLLSKSTPPAPVSGAVTPSSLKTKSPVRLKPTAEPVRPQSSTVVQKPAQVSTSTDSIAQKERGFVTNVKTSETSSKPLKKGVQGTYTPITNEGTLTAAQKTIKISGWDNAKKKLADEPFSAENNMIGQELMMQAQNAGKHDEAIEIAETLARKGTEAGQSVQAFSAWSRMTPEGMLRYATQQVDNAKKNAPLLNKLFGMKNVKLDANDSKIITDLMKKANAATSETEKAAYVKEAFEYIGKKLPWGVSDILDEYRYNNMLSNPLTHLRNVYSNLVQTYITRPSTLLAQGKISDALKYELGAIKALPDAFTNAANTFKGNKPLGRLDTVIKDGPIKPSRLSILGLPSKALEAGDQFFTTLIKGGEKGLGATDEAAEAMAQYTLFRQDLKPDQQGILLNKIDDVTKAVYQLRKVGLGWFIPFVRTPMNVAKQMLEYSPAGVLTTVGAKNKREQLGKAFLGSMAMAYGANMALQDRTTWAAPTDPKEKELFYAAGKKPFSIKIGNKWVPMQYAGVYQWAVGLPAAYKYYTQDSRTALTDDQLTKLSKTAASLAYMWSQQTFVSGLASFVNMAQGDVDYNFKRNLAYTAGQLNPLSGMQRYIASVLDPVYRKASSFSDQLKSGVPGMTQDLQPYTSPDGTPQTRNISNYVMPYGYGIENPKYTQQLDQRTQKLQQNAVINKAKKEVEESRSSKMVGDTFIYTNDKGNAVTVDLNFQPKEPKMTGVEVLDKKLISSYKSQITAKEKDIEELFVNGQITAEQAGAALTALEELKVTGVAAKFKKPKKINISIKKVSAPKPNFKLKLSKPKKVTLKKLPKLKVTKSKKIKLKI